MRLIQIRVRVCYQIRVCYHIRYVTVPYREAHEKQLYQAACTTHVCYACYLLAGLLPTSWPACWPADLLPACLRRSNVVGGGRGVSLAVASALWADALDERRPRAALRSRAAARP